MHATHRLITSVCVAPLYGPRAATLVDEEGPINSNPIMKGPGLL